MGNSKDSKSKSARWHTIYSIISTIFETAAIAAALIWVLPLFNIIIPLWGLIVILVGFLAFSYIMYAIGHPTVMNRSINDPESIIGSTGIVESDLKPEGYIRVRGELWKATCINGVVKKDSEVIVTHLDSMILTVEQK